MEVNLRAVVLDILEEIESNNEFSHIIINNALLKYQYLDKSKRSFINKLSLGIIESQRRNCNYRIDKKIYNGISIVLYPAYRC